MIRACHPSIWEAEAGESGIQGHPQLCGGFEFSLVVVKTPCQKQKRQQHDKSHDPKYANRSKSLSRLLAAGGQGTIWRPKLQKLSWTSRGLFLPSQCSQRKPPFSQMWCLNSLRLGSRLARGQLLCINDTVLSAWGFGDPELFIGVLAFKDTLEGEWGRLVWVCTQLHKPSCSRAHLWGSQTGSRNGLPGTSHFPCGISLW